MKSVYKRLRCMMGGWFRPTVELGAISLGLEVEPMAADDFGQWKHGDTEEEGAKRRPLGDN